MAFVSSGFGDVGKFFGIVAVSGVFDAGKCLRSVCWKSHGRKKLDGRAIFIHLLKHFRIFF